MKFIISLILTVFLMTVTGSIAYSQSTNINPETDTVKIIPVKVKGITCSTDLKTISANVEKLKGVISCKAGRQGTTTTFEIKYDPALLAEKEIFAAIENTGGCENPDDRPYKVKQ